MVNGPMRRTICCILAVLAAFVELLAAPAGAAPTRIISINACTDQLLLALADRHQIIALTIFARDPRISFYAERAAGLSLIRGTAEEVLKLKPDLVLAGSFTSRATREVLAAQGVRVATFAPATSVMGVRKQIIDAASLIGQEARGQGLVAGLDDAFAGLAPVSRPLRALQLERRGFASGAGTLVDDIMQRLGIGNAASDLGITEVGRTSIEAVLKAKPDLLILDSVEPAAADQGIALLIHPALEELIPARRRVVIPPNQLICGSPALAQAAQTLRRAVNEIAAER